MTKKDYKLIADNLAKEYRFYRQSNENKDTTEWERGFYAAVYAVSLSLLQDTPRFNHEKFYGAIYHD